MSCSAVSLRVTENQNINNIWSTVPHCATIQAVFDKFRSAEKLHYQPSTIWSKCVELLDNTAIVNNVRKLCFTV
jgi:hypothetical protein